jgi:UV DNA damage endonuclease
MRITTHPGHFNKLTSPKEEVIQRTMRDLEIHGEIFDLMCLPRTHFAKINIHVGATYNDRRMALDNFCKNFERLPESVRSRLTVENDDKASLYSTKELYDEVYTRIGVPIVFDYHHHKFCTGDQTEREAVHLAASTWGTVRPVVHYSESRADEHNDDSIKPQAHSDSYVNPIDFHGLDLDVMLEAKHKEIALFKMRELLKNNLTMAA